MDPWDELLPDYPPADPEQWSSEQWIEWLKATDADAQADHGAPPVTRMGRVIQTGAGQLLGQAMLGMASAMYGRRDEEIVIVAEGDSEPDPDQRLSVHLDPDHPEQSFVVLRREEHD
jgi:hypothetical protein